jgi:hypothetical protein
MKTKFYLTPVAALIIVNLSLSYRIPSRSDHHTILNAFPTKSLIEKYIIDYDGDGRSDISVFSIKDNTLYFKNQKKQKWTVSFEIPVPILADYSGDKQTDIAFFDKGFWHIFGYSITFLGTKGDIPVPGDYDGNGNIDIAVWRPSTGYWIFSTKQDPIFWGMEQDIPIPFDYNNDGKTNIAVWRPSNGTWYIRYSLEETEEIQWGTYGDIPIPGDYDGNHKTDIAVWRPQEGKWYIKGQGVHQMGNEEDIPVPGDYDGDGATDLAIWRPSAGKWIIKDQKNINFGLPHDIPMTWNIWILWKKGFLLKKNDKKTFDKKP